MNYQHGPLDPDPEPQVVESAPAWERLRDESPRAYTAFQLYLHSATRRLAEVGAALTPACSAANVARWSSKHNWQRRAWRFDREQDRVQAEQEARERSAARKRHLQIAMTMQEVAVHGLLELKAKIASGTALNMSPTEIENMLTEAIKLERLTLGVERDISRFTDIRVFIGTHYNPDEPGYGQPQQYEEWHPNPPILDEDGEDEPRALPQGNS